MVKTVEVSFFEIFEKDNALVDDWKGLSTACGTNKRLRTCFQHSNIGTPAGIRVQPLD